MFPKVFEKAIKGYQNVTHCGVSFATVKSKVQIINLIKKLGLGKFLEGDNPVRYDNYNYDWRTTNGKKQYEDDRIAGTPTYHARVQCCSWTKDSTRWFLFPITDANFKSVGLTIDDVLHYLKTFNDFKVGFDYLYLGLHAASTVGPLASISAHTEQHWFAVPARPKATEGRKTPGTITYLHWIFLRMLINTCATAQGYTPVLPYFNFPRVFMYLKDDMKLNPWKAFLYAHAASGWYNYYSMTNAHSNINIPEQIQYVPDLSVTKKDFKQVWYGGYTLSMNSMICSLNNINLKNGGSKIEFHGKHDVTKSIPLWTEEKYAEFIQYMDSVYYPSLAKKANVSKAKAITRGKKKATKPASKRAAKAHN